MISDECIWRMNRFKNWPKAAQFLKRLDATYARQKNPTVGVLKPLTRGEATAHNFSSVQRTNYKVVAVFACNLLF